MGTPFGSSGSPMRRTITLLAALVLVAAGCRSTPMSSVHLGRRQETPATGRVAKLLVIWTDSVLQEGGRPVAQGIIGRVYLVGPDSDEPVTAPGEFRFYGYDEPDVKLAGGQRKAEPDHQWSFRAEEAAQTLRKDVLGWGYTFWLPCGPPGHSDRSCSVRVRFLPERGGSVMTDATLVTLPSMTNSKVCNVTRRTLDAREVSQAGRVTLPPVLPGATPLGPTPAERL